jgi:hypothetical protein
VSILPSTYWSLSTEFAVVNKRVFISAASWSAVALASMAFNLLWSASVNVLESDAASTAAAISALLWSAVALASIALSFVWSASVNTLESVAASTAVRI